MGRRKWTLWVVKILLETKGIDPNSRDNVSKSTSLLRAAAKGHEEVVRLLFAHSVDPNLDDKYGRTPLLWAAGYGH